MIIDRGFRAVVVLAATASLIVSPAPTRAQTPVQVDVVVRGGLVVDGSGTVGRVADVGFRGDRIVFIGDATSKGITAKQSIDAKGLVVVPGFIDPHAHVLGDLASTNRDRRVNAAYLM